jgi:autotransporter-associated beta strand protein
MSFPTQALKHARFVATLLAALALAPLPARAATNIWGGTGANANWTTVGNWTNSAAPNSSDTVFFGNTNYASGLTTTLGSNWTVNSLVLNTTNAVVISGNTLTLQSGSLERTTPIGGGVKATNVTINSAILLGANGFFNIWGSNSVSTNLLINGSIGESGGSRSLTVAGNRTVHLMGSNTFTGTLLITNTAEVIVGGTNAASSVIVGDAGGAGGVLLVGGDYALGNGTLVLNTNAQLYGYGAAMRLVGNAVSANGNFTLGAVNQKGLTFTNLLTLNANLTISNGFNAAETNFFLGGIGDSGAGRSLTYIANAINRYLFLSNSTYTGATVINGGTLLMSGTNATSAVALNSGTMLTFLTDNPFSASTMITASNATLFSSGAHVLSNPVTFTGTTNAFNTATAGNRLTLNGTVTLATNMVLVSGGAGGADVTIINGSVGEVTPGTTLTTAVSSNRKLVLSSNNTYTGATFINNVGNGTTEIYGSNATASVTVIPGAKLLIGNNNALGTGTFSANATSGTITLAWTNSPVIANAIQMRGTNQLDGLGISGNRIVFNGPVTMTSNVVLNLSSTISSLDPSAPVFNGGFSDSGNNFSLTVLGANNRYLFLSNSSSYGGGTFILNGLLKLGGDNALPTAGALAVNAISGLNDGFSLNGFNQTVGSLSGTGVVQLASGGTLTVGDAGNSAFNGLITGNGILVKQGSGIFTLGGSNSYTGGTIISNGLVRLGAARAMTNGASLTLNGGSLDMGAFSASVGTLSGSGGSLTNSAGLTVNQTSDDTFSGILTGPGSLTKQGGGVLALGGANNYSGGTFLSNGTLSISSDANLGDASGGVTFRGGALRITGTALSNLNARTANWANFNLDIADASHTFTVTNSLANAKLVKGGAGTLVLNNAAITNLGFSADGGTLRVVSGASTLAGGLSVSNGSTLLLSGTNGQTAGTQPSFTLGGALTVGNADSGNSLILNDGASVAGATAFTLGSAAASRGNRVVLSGSTLTNSVIVGSSGSDNSLVVSNGGSVVGATLSIGSTASSSNNLVLISGNGSSVVSTNTSAGVYVGSIGSQNTLVVTNGGRFSSAGSFYVANGAGASNLLLVSGAGSIVSNNTHFHMGMVGASNNAVLVNDGGLLVSGGLRLGSGLESFNNTLVITGAGSMFRTAVSGNQIAMGSNGTTSGTASLLLIQDQGTLEFGQGAGNIVLAGGFNNTAALTNQGGILQFTTITYLITPNTKDSFVMTNGTLSYRGVAAADITSGRFLTNFVMQGDNSFRLLNSTNLAITAYTFDSTAVSTNFQRLILSGNASRWQSGRLNVGTGGELLVTNAANATVGATFTNLGSVRVINSTVIWQSNVVLSGSYFSDPSTNTFATNVTVTASGSLSGSNGDLFVFGGNFLNQSTNRSAFNLWQSAVLFTNLSAGTTNHTYDVSGSASVNYGTGFTNLDRVSTNFAIGTLSIAYGNRLTLTGSVSAVDGRTNAVYVGWLDIQGILTNSFDNVTNGLFNALNLANINLYYDRVDPRNDWLNANLTGIAAGGYDLWGGGLLLPIPEPSALLALGGGAILLVFLRRRKV